MTQHHFWTPDEMQYLALHYQDMTDAEIATKLGRTMPQVCVQRSRQGLTKYGKPTPKPVDGSPRKRGRPPGSRNQKIVCVRSDMIPGQKRLFGAYGNQSNKKACRVCGCTETLLCKGGCWWVAEDLCSKCEVRWPI